MDWKPLVIIPAYNEELTVGSVVALASKYGDVLVVDDGSTDRTSEVAQKAGAVVIRHPANRGKGAALKTGFEYALSKGYEVVVTIDPYRKHDIGRFLFLRLGLKIGGLKNDPEIFYPSLSCC